MTQRIFIDTPEQYREFKNPVAAQTYAAQIGTNAKVEQDGKMYELRGYGGKPQLFELGDVVMMVTADEVF